MAVGGVAGEKDPALAVAPGHDAAQYPPADLEHLDVQAWDVQQLCHVVPACFVLPACRIVGIDGEQDVVLLGVRPQVGPNGIMAPEDHIPSLPGLWNHVIMGMGSGMYADRSARKCTVTISIIRRGPTIVMPSFWSSRTVSGSASGLNLRDSQSSRCQRAADQRRRGGPARERRFVVRFTAVGGA